MTPLEVAGTGLGTILVAVLAYRRGLKGKAPSRRAWAFLLLEVVVLGAQVAVLARYGDHAMNGSGTTATAAGVSTLALLSALCALTALAFGALILGAWLAVKKPAVWDRAKDAVHFAALFQLSGWIITATFLRMGYR